MDQEILICITDRSHCRPLHIHYKPGRRKVAQMFRFLALNLKIIVMSFEWFQNGVKFWIFFPEDSIETLWPPAEEPRRTCAGLIETSENIYTRRYQWMKTIFLGIVVRSTVKTINWIKITPLQGIVSVTKNCPQDIVKFWDCDKH